jgi:raffinose/stachyose/melibiose transport system permease protein
MNWTQRFNRKGQSLLINHIVLIILALFALSPIAVMLFNSVKNSAEIGRNPLGLPQIVHLENFPQAWEQGQFATTVGNSVILVIGTVAAELVLGGLAAYSLARKQPPGSNIVMFYMLVASTIPIWLYLVPLFFTWRSLNLLNSRIGLILIYTALNAPFSIFLLRTYLIGLPVDFEDAAKVDGANEVQILTRVVLPLTWPGFLTVGLVVGLGVWSEFQIALIFVQDPALFPVTTSYFKFSSQHSGRDWGLTSAGAAMMVIPVMILFLLLQRRFIEGLAQGGIKV